MSKRRHQPRSDGDFILFSASSNSSKGRLPEVWLAALVVFASAAYLAISTCTQVPLDRHAFRQSQTALTAYWLKHTGFKLDYETPVVGAPWSIPFEFPIYQSIVAAISSVTGWPLDPVGRLTSFVFLTLCLLPVAGMTRLLRLPATVFPLFAALFLSSPTYIYWGRAFMIESCALFFTLSALYFFCRLLAVRPGALSYFALETKGISHGSRSWLWNAVLFELFMTLALLQKATTGLPVFLSLFVAFLFFEYKASCAGSDRRAALRTAAGSAAIALALFLPPFSLLVAWTSYADQIKLLNQIGVYLTSSRLFTWNWGTWQDRTSIELLREVVWRGMCERNLGGVVGLATIVLSLAIPSWKAVQDGANASKLIIVSLILGFLPLMMFTRLYLEHDYYLSANMVFPVFALAVAFGALLPQWSLIAARVLLLTILVFNYNSLFGEYLPVARQEFSEGQTPALGIGRMLRRELTPDEQFVSFGTDWSSVLSYISERKGCSVPDFYPDAELVVKDPERYVEPGRLGAIINCSRWELPIKELLRDSRWDGWKIGEAFGCSFAVKRRVSTEQIKGFVATGEPCFAEVKEASYREVNGVSILAISGWMPIVEGARDPAGLDQAVLRIAKADQEPLYLETVVGPPLEELQIPGASAQLVYRFARMANVKLSPGKHQIQLLRNDHENWKGCLLGALSVEEGQR